MKRRNAELGKMRRPMKKTKITEGLYGSVVLYMKFLSLWLLIMGANIISDFRFEILWPIYLLVRSAFDTYKAQGVAFTVFFVCLALTADMLCYFFLPEYWMLYVASCYVWALYVWHTEKGFCIITVLLWFVFLGVETIARVVDVKNIPGRLDFCKPFAAHCIGYPVVSLGFGVKTYVLDQIRERKRREVRKENEFYMQLVQQALPKETTAVTTTSGTSVENATISNAIVPAHTNAVQNNNKVQNHRQSHEKNGHIPNGTIANGVHHSHGSSKSHHRKSMDKCKEHESRSQNHNNSVNSHTTTANHAHSNGAAVGAGADDCHSEVAEAVRSNTSANRRKEKQDKDAREAAEYMQRLETDVKRLRADLQSSRSSEQDLRLQVASLTTSEKVTKGELSCMQREVEELQQKLQSAHSTRTSDKQTITNLERRIAEERRLRNSLETQLNQERKSRKEEARAAQIAAQTRSECTEACKARRRELQDELAECRTTQLWMEEKYTAVEREKAAMLDQLRETQSLRGDLSVLQEKTVHLENSLSAENRIKLDLFSALGEAKRQLEIRETAIRAQDKEIEELKSKIAQVLAVMPNDSFVGGHSAAPASNGGVSRVRLAAEVVASPGSTLDPNATAYTPKNSLIASTEA